MKYVAHAVAVNEHRKLFPGESIYAFPSGAHTSKGVRNEVGFIGAHSDIGGGYAEGDLSDVALSWMYQQAKFAGIALNPLPDKYQTVKSPIWHDSNTRLVGSGFDDAGDRKFKYQGGSAFKQKVAPVFGMTYTGSLPFLQQYPTAQTDAHGNKILRGTIDMKGYSAWLKTNYGLAYKRFRLLGSRLFMAHYGLGVLLLGMLLFYAKAEISDIFFVIVIFFKNPILLLYLTPFAFGNFWYLYRIRLKNRPINIDPSSAE